MSFTFLLSETFTDLTSGSPPVMGGPALVATTLVGAAGLDLGADTELSPACTGTEGTVLQALSSAFPVPGPPLPLRVTPPELTRGRAQPLGTPGLLLERTVCVSWNCHLQMNQNVHLRRGPGAGRSGGRPATQRPRLPERLRFLLCLSAIVAGWCHPGQPGTPPFHPLLPARLPRRPRPRRPSHPPLPPPVAEGSPSSAPKRGGPDLRGSGQRTGPGFISGTPPVELGSVRLRPPPTRWGQATLSPAPCLSPGAQE